MLFSYYNNGKFDPTNYAVKVFQDKTVYQREKTINSELIKRFKELKNSGNKAADKDKTSDMFIYQVQFNDDHKTIVYKPAGVRLLKLTKHKIDQLLKAVKSLHKLEIIHRDLSPNHFYQVAFKLFNRKFENSLLIISFIFN